MNQNLAPVLLFAYNRPGHLSRTLRSLAENHNSHESELIIYIDGPKPGATEETIKNILSVQQLAREQAWCKKLTVHISKKNLGLAESVIHGVSETLSMHDRVIVLEDDMILSPYFLEYMNEGLDKYQNNDNVISIHGYCLPIEYPESTFFLRGADCWGWATWKRGWQLFNPDSRQLMKELRARKLEYDFDFEGSHYYTKMLRHQIEGKIDSWAIRWLASAYIANKLTLYPNKSLVLNIGGDGSGTHPQNPEHTKTNLGTGKIVLKDIPVVETVLAKKMIIKTLTDNLNIRGRVQKIIRGLR